MEEDQDPLVDDSNSPLKDPRFLKGFATCEYQNSGALYCPNSNWSFHDIGFENKRWLGGKTRIDGEAHSGSSCGFWVNYRRDIQLLLEAGANAFRFSIEWSVVEPSLGHVDTAAIAHYHELLDALAVANITPMITLLHFSIPMWFERLGGFERKENIQHFLMFCRLVFQEYRSKVPLWATINEPGIMALCGYVLGIHAPGKRGIFQAGDVLSNLLEAHCQVYDSLKALPGGEEARIGLVHNPLKFEPSTRFSPLSILCWTLNRVSHTRIYEFLRANTHRLDFYGLNFYSRALLSITGPTSLPGEIMTPMGWATNSQAFRAALCEAGQLGKPVYVTENGVPDEENVLQIPFLRGYLGQLRDVMESGLADVRGYFYWTLMDNWEWNKGYSVRFGLYSHDPVSKEITPRSGLDYFRRVFQPR